METEITSTKQRIERWLQIYHDEDINSLKKSSDKSLLEIDFNEINSHFEDHYDESILVHPNFFNFLSMCENNLNKNRSADKRISLKIVDIPHNAKLKDLNTDFIGKFVSTSAMVKNITPIQARITNAAYECRGCMRLHHVAIKEGESIVTPTLCYECGSRSFKLLPDESDFIDTRFVKLEEPLELRQSGMTREFKAYMDNYLADPNYIIKPGDVCEVSGLFDVVKNDKTNDWEFLFKLHNIKPQNSAFEEIQLSKEDIDEIQELSQKKDIFQLFVNSIAPSVYGYNFIKEGIVLQLFEGNRPKNDLFKSENHDRWVIHILLIGDPGLGKSKIIKEIERKAPKNISISGTGSSKAGLTASAVKDELTGSWAMEAGAIVLADGGTLTIDEFDKLNPKTQKSLNEPMEQLTVSAAKAGLVQTMTARTSVLAAANPKFSRFDPYEPIKKQLDIPDSTLSRFDLVYVMEDEIDKEKDKELSINVLRNSSTTDEDSLDVILLRKYISYAKMECHPILTEEAEEAISRFYVETRQAAKNNDDSKPITLREMKAIERLSVARAKIELRDYVRLDDAFDAIRIYKDSLNSLGLNPEIAGELQGVKSPKEIKHIKKAESLIKEKVSWHGINLPGDAVEEIKAEIASWSDNDVGVVEELYDEAFKNIINIV